MATKKVKKEIVIEQKSDKCPNGIKPMDILYSKDRLLNTTTIPLSQKIGALMIATKAKEVLETQIKFIAKQLEDAPYADIESALVAEGVIAPGETPIFTAINSKGEKISQTLAPKTTAEFHWEDFKAYVEDPDHFAALPDEYKVTDIQGKDFFKKLYKADAILPIYKEMFSSEDRTKNSLTTTKTK